MFTTSKSNASNSNVASTLRAINRDSVSSELDRQLALMEARNLVNRLENPWDTALRYSWIHPTRMACLRVAMDVGLFKNWKGAGGGAKSGEELQELVSCDPVLLRRILQHLASTQMLEQSKPNVFNLTPFAAALAEPQMASTVDMYMMINGPGFINMPKYLAKNGHKNPTDAAASNWVDMTGKSAFEWFAANPEAEAQFGLTMSVYAANRPPLSQVYPTDQLVKNTPSDGVLLVDCGGSVGHDIARFRQAHPPPTGRLILQDRPEVIDNAKDLDESIEKMPHDFFTPQPVKDAAAYYFHFILHDWPDNDCNRILDNVKPSMKKGFSKLLLHEVVMDPTALSDLASVSDITMMGMASAQERTANDWSKLLDKSGFKIIRIHSNPLAAESVIEAEPL